MAHVKPTTDAKSSRYSLPRYDPNGIGSYTDGEPWQITGDDSPRASSSNIPSSPAAGPGGIGRRGRRRRSSEFVQIGFNQEDARKTETDEIHKGDDLLWWQRPRMAEHSKTAPEGLPALDTRKDTTATPSSPSIRSPAAAFLSSMNDMLSSPSSDVDHFSEHSRTYSLSPSRGPSFGSSMPDPAFASLPPQHSHNEMDGSQLGFASAAAHLYNTAQQASTSHTTFSSLRPDDEGARIGPDRRYLLGKTIGFGGFSTIREAWDLGPNAGDDVDKDWEGMHKVAVKIVYSSESEQAEERVAAEEEEEMRIWESIPSHPNLLPLLYYERIVLNDVLPSAKTSSISLLVMPYCQGSLLAFVKSEGKLPSMSVVLPEGTSMTRSSSLYSNQLSFQNIEGTSGNSFRSPTSRTGSGFIHRANVNRVVSVPQSAILSRSPSLATSPSNTESSSLLRRVSSRTSRNQRQTNGVPLSVARDVMRQLTDALLCLHTKAGVVHGDLKLENVLGQRSTTSHFDIGRKEDTYRDDEESVGSQADVSIVETICWRVADFGLARRVKSDVQKAKQALPANKRKIKEKAGGAGGSLAYTAPELFLPTAVNGKEEEGTECSPYASDMWALGCILYVLCSGKLPFSDSFEPRLQMKIAKGKWEMPNRLKRCQERGSQVTTIGRNSGSKVASDQQQRERSISSNLASNAFSASYRDHRPYSHIQSNSTSGTDFTDMSASMPALQERRYYSNGIVKSTSGLSIIDHEADESFQTKEQEEEESIDSDQDERVDQSMDGKSQERVWVRLALRQLLEPDPHKRWTIEQLARLPWISQASANTSSGHTLDDSQLLQQLFRTDRDVPMSLEDALQGAMRRPSLAQESILERASQEDEVSLQRQVEEDHYVNRGRSKQRDGGRQGSAISGAAKPIDIDRSKSRSQSRPGFDRKPSSPWNLESSWLDKKYEMPSIYDDWNALDSKRVEKRSSSADTHSRGRNILSGARSASRPGHRVDLSSSHYFGRANESSTRGSNASASRSSTSRSRSRARDALQDIVEREGGKKEPSDTAIKQDDSGEETLWWQRGRKK
jgi:hypothetical protein